MWPLIFAALSSYLPMCIKTISVIEKAEMVYSGYHWLSDIVTATFRKRLQQEETIEDWVMIEPTKRNV